jgi:serine/threonine protein kinase
MLTKKEGEKLEVKNFKICDFGLAMKEGSHSFIYKRCGTPGYVPPEVVNATSAGPESIFFSSKWDTFSVGVLLYMLISKRKLILAGASPFQAPDVKQILLKSAECKVNYKHPLLGKQSVEMHALLRGLLNPDHKARLSAKEALSLPVFDEYRGTQLPLQADKKSSAYTETFTFTTILENESNIPLGSIKSLEQKSTRIAPKGSSDYQPSLYSVVYEGDVPKLVPHHQGFCQLSEQGILSQLDSCIGSGFKKPLTHGKQSEDMEEANSYSENISPLVSPHINHRLMTKSNSIHVPYQYGVNLNLKNQNTGFTSKPNAQGCSTPTIQTPKTPF